MTPQPLYLNAIDREGNRSSGPHVALLQMFLIGMDLSDVWSNMDQKDLIDEETLKGMHEIHERLHRLSPRKKKEPLFREHLEMQVTGVYDEDTVFAVKNLQIALEVESDGNFGPATRAALLKKTGIDFNKTCQLLTEPPNYAQPDGSVFRGDPPHSS